MKTKALTFEHANMMFYSREILDLKIPSEINTFYFVLLSFFMFVFTALFAFKINNVIKVPGIVKTLDNTSEVSNVIAGKITSINYKPNQFVNKGDLLFSIDDSQYKASLSIYNEEITKCEKELSCVKNLLKCMETGLYIETEDAYTKEKIKEYLKNISLMKNQRNIYKYQYEYQISLPDSIQNKKALTEIELQYSLYKKQLEKYIIDSKVSAMDEEKNLAIKLENLKQELLQLNAGNAFLNVTAPVSGYVQEISSLNIGDYIFSNQKVLKIIPNDNKDFKIELYIPTKDIGEVMEGMDVKYRLSAFPFFEYKGAEGKIKIIDPDIRQTNDKLIYCVYSDINKTSFVKNDGKEYPLRSGIEVDARIILEKVTIASYILRKMGITK
ncbi:MAG: HlyD family secretion protein [Treponema sp.]|nr:HlyD family secretion protein [Treponema sp.]